MVYIFILGEQPANSTGECRAGYGQQGDGICRLQRLHHWGVKGHHYYLLNVFRRKLEFPDLKRAVREQQQLYRADVVVIETRLPAPS